MDLNGIIDYDLYLAHLLPLVSVINLHERFAKGEKECVSTAKCFTAAHTILSSLHQIISSELDLKYINPHVCSCKRMTDMQARADSALIRLEQCGEDPRSRSRHGSKV